MLRVSGWIQNEFTSPTAPNNMLSRILMALCDIAYIDYSDRVVEVSFLVRLDFFGFYSSCRIWGKRSRVCEDAI